MKEPGTNLLPIARGTKLRVTYLDDSTDEVLVHELPIRKLVDLVEINEDEAASVELYCDRPKGWADNLTHESHEAVLAEGRRINFPAMERLLDRKKETVEWLLGRSRALAASLTQQRNAPASKASPSTPSASKP